MKKPCDILKDFLYRFYAKRIPYEQRQDALVRFYSNYTSAPIFDSMMKKLSLIHNDQKPEFAESWFSQKLIHDEVYKIFSWFNNSEYMLLDIGANAGYSVSSMYSAGHAVLFFRLKQMKCIGAILSGFDKKLLTNMNLTMIMQ